MAKRGQLVFIAIITLVVAAVIGFTYPRISQAYATGVISDKLSAVRDIALNINTVCALPYDFEIRQEIDLSKYVIKISENKVKIYDMRFIRLEDGTVIEEDPSFKQYSFVCSQNLNFVLDRPKTIIYEKNDGILDIMAEK